MVADGGGKPGEPGPSSTVEPTRTPVMPPPTPWELEVQIAGSPPRPVAVQVDTPISVYGRESLISACFAAALGLLAVAVDLRLGPGWVGAAALAILAVAVGLRVWATPVLVIEPDHCTTMHYLFSRQRFAIDGVEDVVLDGMRLTRRSDGRLLSTLRPALLRGADMDRLRRSLDAVSANGPIRRQVY